MSTNPQSPHGSPSEARGSQSPRCKICDGLEESRNHPYLHAFTPKPHPVAEGRQSPGLEEAAKIIFAEFATGADWNGQSLKHQAPFLDVAQKILALAAPGAPQGGGDELDEAWTRVEALKGAMLVMAERHPEWSDFVRGYVLNLSWQGQHAPATPSQEERPAAAYCDECGAGLSKQGTIIHQMGCSKKPTFAQAPASSPRDLEAGDLDAIQGVIEIAANGNLNAHEEEILDAARLVLADLRLAAHPPEGETPSEAAGLEAAYRAGYANGHGDATTEHRDGYDVPGVEKHLEAYLETLPPAPGTPIEKAAREAGALRSTLRDVLAEFHSLSMAIRERCAGSSVLGDILERMEEVIDGSRASLSSLPQEGGAIGVTEHRYAEALRFIVASGRDRGLSDLDPRHASCIQAAKFALEGAQEPKEGGATP
jgi:hypothetical protein